MIDVAVGGGASFSGGGPLQPSLAWMFGVGTNFEPTQKIYASTVDSGFYLNILVDINKPEW